MLYQLLYQMLYIDIFFSFRCVVLLNGVISSGTTRISTFESAAFKYSGVRMSIFERWNLDRDILVSKLKVETLA